MDSSDDFLGSAENKETRLFNDRSFPKIHEYDHESFRLMANCVILANATILKERQLLPDKYFYKYPVYGNVMGYMVNRDTPDGEKVAQKLEACREPIKDKLLHKLAIVVEETLHSQPVETFIWNFTYDTSSRSASAEIGYGSQRSKFTVDYKNMQDTCQQFCKLFSKLQDILKKLKPLPEGMIPSLKVAYRGDPVFVAGFQHIDEFVSLEEVHVDSVAFPHNSLQLSYASQFINNRLTHLTEELYDPVYSENGFDLSMSEPQIEVIRQDTMCHENYENIDCLALASTDDIIDTSMNCNPNNITTSDERKVLQSEFATADLQTDPDAPRINIPEERLTSRISHKDGRKSSGAKTKRKEPIYVSQGLDVSKTVPQKKKCARRLQPDEENIILTDDELVDDLEMVQEEEPMDVENVRTSIVRVENVEFKPLHKKNTRRSASLLQSEEVQVRKSGELRTTERANVESKQPDQAQQLPTTFARVGSLKALIPATLVSETVSSVDPITHKTVQNRERYGKTLNFLMSENSKESSPRSNEGEEKRSALNFARVSSVLGVLEQTVPCEKQVTGERKTSNWSSKESSPRSNEGPANRSSRNFARISSVLDVLEETVPCDKQGTGETSTVVSTRRFGRVSNVLTLVDQTRNIQVNDPNDVSTPHSRRYGRVRSLKESVEQQLKSYGHSQSLRTEEQ